MQTELEDAFERFLPELRKREQDHRNLLTLIYQSQVSENLYSTEDFIKLAVGDLKLSENTITSRLKDLRDLKLIESARSKDDGRKLLLALADDAYATMQAIGDHAARCVLHYAELIKHRGRTPPPAPNLDLFDPLKKED
ncbi:MAG: hypothetical protein EOQ87_32760 [Mesorhizobium sp.]|nr:MAG: hypothetical protein EOQ85_32825 [Mesorhizobium sp.]RWH83528.1 MAG: hypothetical protein EOQ87_32760 [Mesorhizobium sp.]